MKRLAVKDRNGFSLSRKLIKIVNSIVKKMIVWDRVF